jgi:hypothetical protein
MHSSLGAPRLRQQRGQTSLSDNTDLIKSIGTRFIERRDVKAVQGEGIPWQPIREKFTLQDFEDHIAGKRTFGHYLVSPEGNAKLFAFDIDLDKTGVYYTEDIPNAPEVECNPRDVWLDPNHPGRWTMKFQLRCVAEALAAKVNRLIGIPVAVAYSGGKGLHVYGFTGSKPAPVVRTLALGVMEEMFSWQPTRGENFWKHTDPGVMPNITIEVFPKQDTVGEDGFGNLMALPLGIHKLTGQRKYFCRLTGPIEDGWSEMNPINALSGDNLPWE